MYILIYLSSSDNIACEHNLLALAITCSNLFLFQYGSKICTCLTAFNDSPSLAALDNNNTFNFEPSILFF